MRLRRAAHDWSLLFCGAVAVYLVSAVVAARLAVWLAAAIRSSPSAAARVVLGVLALDLSKAIGLTLAALLLANVVKLGALATALGLVLLTYALDVVVSMLLQQGGWLVLAPAVLACRVAAVALLVALVQLVVRRRRRASPT
jgi:hypothetical protein